MVGGGHAHLAVLRALANEQHLSVDAVLVTPSKYQNYSAMLPGWISGHYPMSAFRIDLESLAQAAGVRLLLGSMAGMDAERRCIALENGLQINYDLLSLDVGSETNTSWLEVLGPKLLPTKPLDRFISQWPCILASARTKHGYQLVVVGAGVCGVEIALAVQYAFTQAGVVGEVHLVASEAGLLPGHARATQARMVRLAQRAGLFLHFQRGVGTEQGVLLADGTMLLADAVIAATGARAPVWLALAKLELDAQGFLLVDKNHQSISHRSVFAAGNICSRKDTSLSRSGVHASRVGSVLAHNLLVALGGGSLQTYLPKRRTLCLLACGPRYAVASWGRYSAEGHWVWRCKDWIDRHYIGRFSKTDEVNDARMQEHRP